jgi:hypothetical protein
MEGKMKKVTLVIIALTFLSCSLAGKKGIGKQQLTKSYRIGEVQTVKLGEPIARLNIGPTYPMYEAKEDYLYKPTLDKIKKGDKWIAWLTTDEGYVLIKEDDRLNRHRSGYYWCWGVELSRDGILGKKPWVVVWTFEGDFLKTDEQGFAKLERPMQEKWPEEKLRIFSKCKLDYFVDQERFVSEIIYTGKKKNNISFLFKQYYGGNEDRPSSQQLKYDLDKYNVINIKSLNIQILDATRENITFKILSDGNTPWVTQASKRENTD